MYGHVCETGGTREVLPPRPLNVSRLRICLNLKIDFVRSGQTLGLNDYKQDLFLCCNLLLLVDLLEVLWGPSRHLGSSTAANWVSFDLNVSCSSC